ncbi:MAG: type VI secretion system-associated protein TagF [Pseudomonadota bacterium]
MSVITSLGFFGKLPAHGDFIHRGLRSDFVSVWDEWLQGFVSSSRERLGDAWLDIYLTSPIWRFFLSAGVIDNHQWAGVTLPSVDRVGRYYPFSIVAQVDVSVSSVEFIAMQKQWYEDIETLCLAALDEELAIDSLLAQANGLQSTPPGFRSKASRKDLAAGLALDLDAAEQTPAAIYPQMLDTLIGYSLPCHSLWFTSGSELVKATTLITQGLPSKSKIAAMLDGRWQQWGWLKPYDDSPTN